MNSCREFPVDEFDAVGQDFRKLTCVRERERAAMCADEFHYRSQSRGCFWRRAEHGCNFPVLLLDFRADDFYLYCLFLRGTNNFYRRARADELRDVLRTSDKIGRAAV